MLRIIPAACFFFLVPFKIIAQLSGTLQYGKYPVGFKTIDTRDSAGGPFRICIWYPAAKKGSPMRLSDYVDIPAIGGPQDKEVLRNELKKILELDFVMGLSEIPREKYDLALTATVAATLNAVAEKGNWPLILNDTEPSSLCITNEFLASHGFIVVTPAMQYPPPENDKTLYRGPTQGLLTLLNYMVDQQNVDKEQVFAFGFGGGAMASFYLAMRTGKIRLFANVEGGLFMPESKTTLSADYSPSNFKATLLHIITPPILSRESSEEYNAVKSTKYRVIEKVQLRHHDFTIYGRIVNGLLQLRGPESEQATAAYSELHQFVLSFFKEGKLGPGIFDSSRYFKLE